MTNKPGRDGGQYPGRKEGTVMEERKYNNIGREEV